uniref:sphingomyelin phosphodiesterase 2 isoform X2 n=2 Tax=Myxine glutinosa TaxID=7769 RepID=UPI00358E65F8
MGDTGIDFTDMAEDMQFDLKVLTLNCWGIRYLSKLCSKRYKCISQKLSEVSHDVALLEEVWSEKDYMKLKEKLASYYPHSHYFRSGVIGSGLCVFSKHPIIDTLLYQYSLNGYPFMLHHGDWFGGKSVGLVVLNLSGIIVNAYVTHLHAEYSREKDAYHPHRILQAWELGQFVRHTSQVADIVLLGGDLNMHPDDLGNRLLRSLTGLRDSFIEADSYEGPEGGCTSIPQNSFTSKHEFNSFPQGIRIDYILFKGSDKYSINCRALQTTQATDGREFPISDHEAVSATLQVQHGTTQRLLGGAEIGAIDVLNEARTELRVGLHIATGHQRGAGRLFGLSIALVLLSLAIALCGITSKALSFVFGAETLAEEGLPIVVLCLLGLGASLSALLAIAAYVLFTTEIKALRGAEDEMRRQTHTLQHALIHDKGRAMI